MYDSQNNRSSQKWWKSAGKVLDSERKINEKNVKTETKGKKRLELCF